MPTTKRPVAVLDACVLVPMPLADTLLRLAEPPALYEPRWTDEILAEVTRTLVVRFGRTPENARYREMAMREFFPDALVTDYEPLIESMTNDPKDRHVLAAAVACRADCVVTFNSKHFPRSPRDAHGIAIMGPSAFLKQLLATGRGAIEERLCDQARAIGMSRNDLLGHLDRSIPNFVSSFRDEAQP
ncbi:MAG: PIN domain-containing protein [Bryobacteraceae bacterium]